jgi:hypothetical protein
LPESGLAGIIAAKSGVNHHGMVYEMLANITKSIISSDQSGRNPKRRVRSASSDIWRDLSARKVPDLDGGVCPFHGVDSTSNIIEG